MKITRRQGPDIPETFMGLFLEDINYAVDGGLYAELLENRNFESLDCYGDDGRDYYVKYDGLYAWENDSPDLTLEIVQGSPVSEANPHYLRATCAAGGRAFRNKAYNGLFLRPGVPCRASFYARRVRYQGAVTVAVQKDGRTLLSASTVLRPAGEDGWNRWERYELTLCPEEEIQGGVFTVILEEPGVVEFDFFSLLPEDAVLGVFRRDLVQALQDLHPASLRVPGGGVTEGATLANRYQFKRTLGWMEDRCHNWNRWAVEGNSQRNGFHGAFAHYGQTGGIGFYEYFQLCEYLGAKPLPVLGVGLACQYQSHERVEPEDEAIREFIQDYLDLIEFANGGADTQWGGLRCRMGHPAPFGLEMIGVGNEQWETPESRFFERYTLFAEEIHRVYPDIRLIGTAGPELDSPRFQAAWQFYKGKPEDFVWAVDEHFYTSPEWFLSHTDYFDQVPRSPKIFFGEYAAHIGGRGTPPDPQRNSLGAALAEAAFLTGMARNSDAVVMTCYAPLLARLGFAQWDPDLIWFDETAVCRTPSYFVQQLFARNLGTCNIQFEDGILPCQVGYDARTEEITVFLVNCSGEPRDIPLDFDPAWHAGPELTEVLLTGDPAGVNMPGSEAIQPLRRQLPRPAVYQVPPCALAVLRIPAKPEA